MSEIMLSGGHSIADRLKRDGSPIEKAAQDIGANVLRAFSGPEKSIGGSRYLYRVKLPSKEKVWQTSPAILMDEAWLDGRTSNRFTLVAPRKGRKRPVPGFVARLVHNDNFVDPIAFIQPDLDGVTTVVVGTEANNPDHLAQIAPIVAEIVATGYVHPDHIPGLERSAGMPAETPAALLFTSENEH